MRRMIPSSPAAVDNCTLPASPGTMSTTPVRFTALTFSGAVMTSKAAVGSVQNSAKARHIARRRM